MPAGRSNSVGNSDTAPGPHFCREYHTRLLFEYHSSIQTSIRQSLDETAGINTFAYRQSPILLPPTVDPRAMYSDDTTINYKSFITQSTTGFFKNVSLRRNI